MKLIKFSALWCPSCLIMNGRVNKIVDEYNLEYIEYDYDIDDAKVEEYKVGDILPVIIIENNGKEVIRIIGEKSEKELKRILEGVSNEEV